MDEILKAIQESNKAFAEFKQINEKRLAALEKGDKSRADELNEQMKKAFDDIEAHKATMEKLEAKLTNRPGNGAGGNPEKDIVVADHRKAFDAYMRKGNETNLATLTTKALDITNPAEGGYAVPKVIDASIESIVVNISPIRAIASVQQISTSDFHKLVNLRGAASGWVGELAARPATNAPTLIDVIPPMGELYANPQASQQVLDDAFFNMETWLTENVALEFARAEGAAFLTGNGTNMPQGILTATAVTTADDTRAFGSIQYLPTGVAGGFPAVTGTTNPADLLFALNAMLKAAYRQNAKWLMPKSVLFQISAMKDNQGRYVFNPTTAPGVPPQILNYPVIEAEDVPPMANNSLSVAFGDFKRGYLIVDRIGTRVLRDPFSNKPYIGFYTTKRVGGKIIMSEAIKVLKFSVA